MAKAVETTGRRGGQGLAEYLIIVVLVIIACIVCVGSFGEELDAIFQGTDGKMNKINDGAGGSKKPKLPNP